MIYLAADHRGFELKEKIKVWLSEWGYEFQDFGALEYNPDDDYPDFIHKAAEKVSENPKENKAIILGGNGQGEAIAANRYKRVRAAVYYGGNEEVIKMFREHDNTNVLSLGVAIGSTVKEARPMDDETAKKAVKLWLETPFTGEERHKRRIEKIDR